MSDQSDREADFVASCQPLSRLCLYTQKPLFLIKVKRCYGREVGKEEEAEPGGGDCANPGRRGWGLGRGGPGGDGEGWIPDSAKAKAGPTRLPQQQAWRGRAREKSRSS